VVVVTAHCKLDDKRGRLSSFYEYFCSAAQNRLRIIQYETKRTVLTDGKEIYDSHHYTFSANNWKSTIGIELKTSSAEFYADLFDDGQLVIWIMDNCYYINEFELSVVEFTTTSGEEFEIELSIEITDVRPI
jgi:hypothetical protein